MSPATNINVLPGSDGNELSATVPASDGNCAVSASQGVCAVQVTVTTPAGTSSGPVPLPAYQGPLEYGANGAFFAPTGTEGTPQPDEYDYTSAPTITSVSPAYASENGTTAEVITGTGFNLLTFDWANVGTAGPGFNQDFEILGVTPTTLAIGIPASAATVEPVSTPVSVQDSGIPLPSTGDLSSFDYAGTPVLTAISKHLAAQSDPGSLTITGQGLSDVTSVVVQLQGSLDFLSSTSTAISSQSDTSLKVAIPEGFAAPADVLGLQRDWLQRARSGGGHVDAGLPGPAGHQLASTGQRTGTRRESGGDQRRARLRAHRSPLRLAAGRARV